MSSMRVETIADLGSLPFHIGEKVSPSNVDLPDDLPFVVGVQPDIGLMVQSPNATVEAHLDVAYRRGSIIGTPMAATGIGRRYADDFLDFIVRVLAPGSVKGLRILEIGCGNGYLLFRLKQLGAEVLGIEPGEQGQTGTNTYGVEIMRGVFPGQLHDRERFDLIVTHAVLEHVIDPANFLETQSRYLNESGLLIMAVPDCTDHIRTGDVSMFIHEHWNYFSPTSLEKLVALVGLNLLRLEQSGYGGSLYATAGKLAKSGKSATAEVAGDDADTSLFDNRMKAVMAQAESFFEQAARAESSLGIFCAARAINLVYLLQSRAHLRFFDDDTRLHGKYYPPIEVPIESRASLVNLPVDQLIIMSRSFGSKLKEELSREKMLGSTSMILPDELFGNL